MNPLHEVYEKRKQEQRAAFHGRCYRYNTPNDGTRTIGVMTGLGGDIWMVGYFRETGARKRIKTTSLPVLTNPDTVQADLDAWAQQRGLEEVKG